MIEAQLEWREADGEDRKEGGTGADTGLYTINTCLRNWCSSMVRSETHSALQLVVSLQEAPQAIPRIGRLRNCPSTSAPAHEPPDYLTICNHSQMQYQGFEPLRKHTSRSFRDAFISKGGTSPLPPGRDWRPFLSSPGPAWQLATAMRKEAGFVVRLREKEFVSAIEALCLALCLDGHRPLRESKCGEIGRRLCTTARASGTAPTIGHMYKMESREEA